MDSNEEEHVENSGFSYREVIFTDEYEEVEGPPKNLQSHFKSINEWLLNACKNEHPPAINETFNFGLFESPGEYILFFYGTVRGNASACRCRSMRRRVGCGAARARRARDVMSLRRL